MISVPIFGTMGRFSNEMHRARMVLRLVNTEGKQVLQSTPVHRVK